MSSSFEVKPTKVTYWSQRKATLTYFFKNYIQLDYSRLIPVNINFIHSSAMNKLALIYWLHVC